MCIHVYEYVYPYTCKCMQPNSLFVRLCVFVYIYVHTDVYTCIHAHVYTNIHEYIYMYIYIHT